MPLADSILDTFPRLEEIDTSLQQKTIDVWVDAIDNSEFDSLAEIPWWPPHEEAVGYQRMTDHVRDVMNTAYHSAMAIQSSRPNIDINMDHLIAASNLHDISKIAEVTTGGTTEVHYWLPHPHSAVYILWKHDLPLPIQNIALSHSPSCSVEPKSMEGQIVRVADQIALDAIFWEETGTLSGI